MKRLCLAVLALLGVLSTPIALHAQGSTLVGTWQIEYEIGRRMMGDAVEPIMAKGTLVISTQGDSVVAMLTPEPRPDGSARPPRRIAGTASATGATFHYSANGQFHINGETVTRGVQETWTLSAAGESLEGTMLRRIADAPMESAPTPVKGTRVAK